MPSHSVIFATSGGVDSAWGRFAEPLRQAWPGREKPRMDWSPLGSFLELLEGTPAGKVGLPTAAIVVIGDAAPPWEVDRLVEGLHARNLPGICLMRDPGDWQKFQRQGVIFETLDADPDVVAAMLFALCERQAAVDVLAREIFITQRTQGGMRAEMDRLHEELHLAASIQREFLPQSLPAIDQLQVGVVFRPAAYVSGDIYNVERLDEEHVGFFLADAVGHGVPAALLTMVLSHNLTTTELGESSRKIIPPGQVLQRLNDRLCAARPDSGRFATAIYGVINTRTMRVALAGAGHPPPMLVAGGRTSLVQTDGPLLGVFAEATFGEETFVLEPGQTLLTYTDGLEWAFPDGKPAAGGRRRTNNRYLEHLSRLAGEDASVEDVMSHLEHLLDEQSGSLHQVDDVTALAFAAPRRVLPMRTAA